MVILLISYVQFLREALASAMRATNEIEVLSASCRETAEAALWKATPSLIIIDASHPEGPSLVAAVRAHVPKARVIVLAMHDQDEDLLSWAKIGISDYLGPDTSMHDFVSTVRRAAAGEVVCSPRLTALLLNRCADRSSDRASRAGIHVLTAREREIAELLADGLSNKLIARRLQVALPTVKNHVHSILDKWDVRSRGEAAARYRQQSRDGALNGRTPTRLPGSHALHLVGAG
jgi:two-component system nitrate/nitrite response regulator NarL